MSASGASHGKAHHATSCVNWSAASDFCSIYSLRWLLDCLPTTFHAAIQPHGGCLHLAAGLSVSSQWPWRFIADIFRVWDGNYDVVTHALRRRTRIDQPKMGVENWGGVRLIDLGVGGGGQCSVPVRCAGTVKLTQARSQAMDGTAIERELSWKKI